MGKPCNLFMERGAIRRGAARLRNFLRVAPVLHAESIIEHYSTSLRAEFAYLEGRHADRFISIEKEGNYGGTDSRRTQSGNRTVENPADQAGRYLQSER